jgi:serine phosphatase RsbU (regulator of sigma subunit)
MSDGVVEAQDSRGTLFGFERINEMLRHHATPKDIANAAQEFGQEDDILVLQVRRDMQQIREQHPEPEFAVS